MNYGDYKGSKFAQNGIKSFSFFFLGRFLGRVLVFLLSFINSHLRCVGNFRDRERKKVNYRNASNLKILICRL